MQLTQRAVIADLQAYLGLSATELPNAIATVLMDSSFNSMYIFFEGDALYFDDTDAKKQAVQKEAEIYMGAYYYYLSYSPKTLLMDFSTYDTPLAADISLGGVKIGEKGGSKTVLLQWYVKQGLMNRNLAHEKMNTLLRADSDVIVKSNWM